jgi:hypothetical protein
MNSKNPISSFLLERYILGELPRNQMNSVRQAIERDAELQRRTERLIESTASILKRYPAKEMDREIRLKVHARRVQAEAMEMKRSWRLASFSRPLFAAIAVAAVAVGLPLLLQHYGAKSVLPRDVRIKGLEPELVVYHKIALNPGVEKLRNLSAVRAGDMLQLGYVAAGRKFGVIVSLDGNGAVTQHYPEKAAGSTRLTTGNNVLLPNAYELDNAPRFERFLFVTSNDSIDVSAVLDAARKLALQQDTAAETEALDLPRDFRQFSLTLRKVSP